MSYGGFYEVGTATLDESDETIVHITGALLLANVQAEDTFELGGYRVSVADVVDDETVQLKSAWPGEAFEAESYMIRLDSPLRNPPVAVARTIRDLLDRLRIFDESKPIFEVQEFGVNAPPEDYAEGDWLVIGSAPSGLFTGNVNKLARFDGADSWYILAPEYGYHIISRTDPNGANLVRSFDGSDWVLSSGLAAGITFLGEWAGGDIDPPTYVPGNVVLDDFKLWICKAENTNQEPADESDYWLEFPVPGEHGGVPISVLTFQTDTEVADPGAGGVRLNHATAASANRLIASKTDVYGGDRSEWLAGIGTSTTSVQKGKVRLQVIGEAENFLATVMSVSAVGGTHYEMTISSPGMPNGAISNGALVLLYHQERGDVGATGATGPGYRGTSTTNLTIGLGTKTFTTQTGLAYTSGSRFRLSKTDDVGVLMEGVCSTYNAATGAFEGVVDFFRGTGSVNSWNLNLSGEPGAGYRGTSTTNLTVQLGSRTVTTQAGLAYAEGVRARFAAVGQSAWMEGPVASYNPVTGSLAINCTKLANSGTYNNWIVSLAGEPGAAGTNGVNGASALTIVTVVDTAEGDPATDYEEGDTVGGKVLAAGDLVLRATDGGDAADGVYSAPASGAASRHTIYESFDSHCGAEFNVSSGTHAGTKWRGLSTLGGTLDTDPIEIVQALAMSGENNLSELTNTATARTNLGLGDLATLDQGDLDDPVAMAMIFGG